MDTLPKYNFAFNVGFNVKNFEVSLLFQGIGDYDNSGELIFQSVCQRRNIHRKP